MNTKSYLLANKHSGSDINLSAYTNLLSENCCFVGCSLSIRQKDIAICKICDKKWIDEVTKSWVFNEYSSESEKLQMSNEKFKL